LLPSVLGFPSSVTNKITLPIWSSKSDKAKIQRTANAMSRFRKTKTKVDVNAIVKG
jgi:hypothetical protein